MPPFLASPVMNTNSANVPSREDAIASRRVDTAIISASTNTMPVMANTMGARMIFTGSLSSFIFFPPLRGSNYVIPHPGEVCKDTA